MRSGNKNQISLKSQPWSPIITLPTHKISDPTLLQSPERIHHLNSAVVLFAVHVFLTFVSKGFPPSKTRRQTSRWSFSYSHTYKGIWVIGNNLIIILLSSTPNPYHELSLNAQSSPRVSYRSECQKALTDVFPVQLAESRFSRLPRPRDRDRFKLISHLAEDRGDFTLDHDAILQSDYWNVKL